MQFIVTLILFLLTSPAWATTRYVSTTGSDANSCAASENIATPKLTPASAIACMNSGDTLYMRGGTYTTQLNVGAKTGTAGNYNTIASYTGETATIAPSNGSRAITGTSSTSSYWIFDGLVFDGVNHTNGTNGNIIASSGHDIIFRNMEIKNWKYHGLYIEGNNITVENSIIHDQNSVTCASGTRWYGVYFHNGSNGLIQGNQFYNNPGGGIQMFPGPISALTVKKNSIHENGTCTTTDFGGMVISQGSGQTITGVTIANNLVYLNKSGAETDAHGLRVANIVSNTLIINNVFYDNGGSGITLQSAGVSGTIIKNNIVLGNDVSQIVDAGTGTTQTTNKTTGTITDCTVSTSDFTQKAGSSCIGAGTAHAGFAFNGLPDIGAFEAPLIASCSVEAATPTVVNILFSNGVNPPMLPSTGITGISARENAASKTNSGNAIRVGDNQVNQTVTAAFTGGTAIDISISSTNLTESALVGGTLNQPFVQTVSNFPCTNNVAGAPTYEWHQAAYRWFSPHGAMADAPQKPDGATADNVNISVVKGGAAKLHLAITGAVSDPPPEGFFLYYKKNGSEAVQLTNTFGADNIAYCGSTPDPDIAAAGSLTTNRTSVSGTFVALGQMVRTSNGVPTVDIASGEKFANEYHICWSGSAVIGDFYDFEIHRQDGTTLNIVFDVTPRATVKDYQAGFASLPAQPWGMIATPNPTQRPPLLAGRLEPAQGSSWSPFWLVENGSKSGERQNRSSKFLYEIR